jgi:VIT1/CCC1 family predicted Fe2+/Mn2+ transporter
MSAEQQTVSGSQTVERRQNESERIPAAEHRFLLQVVQPGLVGLMDGSVSTLAPIFASAYVTRNPRDAFLVGMAAAVGAAISMGFAEGLSDDGSITGRGNPLTRGIIVALATMVGGGLHTLPFLIRNLDTALILAYFVVGVELVAIAAIRYRYFHMSFIRSVIQVVVGGGLVFAAGYLIGNA